MQTMPKRIASEKKRTRMDKKTIWDDENIKNDDGITRNIECGLIYFIKNHFDFDININ